MLTCAFGGSDSVRYVQINAYSGAWAESIVFGKHYELIANGDESWVFWARGNHAQDEHMQKIASYPEVCFDALLSRIDGKAGFHSKRITRRLLKKLDEINPDVMHLHILIGYYLNVEMLFEWLAKHRCKVLWTLHDCWAFTGHCIHFAYAGCDQWRTHCGASKGCPQTNTYPESFSKSSVVSNFEKKRRLFTMLPPERMTLIAPSQWLADLAKQSFLGKYEICVRYNEIDKEVFKPTPSNIRERIGVDNRFMILGVASKWSEHKGLSDFLALANDLDCNIYAVAVVGVNDKQSRDAPANLITLPRTKNATELAKLYSAADVFFNPTVEDNYPTVNLEAEACGTDVVTYDTGGCRETIFRSGSYVVSSYEEAVHAIEFLRNKNDK